MQTPAQTPQQRQAGRGLAEQPAWAVLGVLGAIWGASFLFMRVAVPAFGPLPVVALRLGLGALVLWPMLWAQRAVFAGRPGLWLKLLGLGLLNSGVPFLLFAWASLRAPAAVVALTNSMAVVFTTLVGMAFFGERVVPMRLLAVAVGLAGVALLATSRHPGGVDAEAALLWPVLAGCTAALMYGFGAHWVKRAVGALPPGALAAATLTGAALISLPFAVWAWPQTMPGALPWAAAIALGVLCTGLAYALFYRLIERIGASRASGVTYIVPVFAVAWAWLLLGEVPSLTTLAAAGLVLGSVAVSQRAGR